MEISFREYKKGWFLLASRAVKKYYSQFCEKEIRPLVQHCGSLVQQQWTSQTNQTLDSHSADGIHYCFHIKNISNLWPPPSSLCAQFDLFQAALRLRVAADRCCGLSEVVAPWTLGALGMVKCVSICWSIISEALQWLS